MRKFLTIASLLVMAGLTAAPLTPRAAQPSPIEAPQEDECALWKVVDARFPMTTGPMQSIQIGHKLFIRPECCQ